MKTYKQITTEERYIISAFRKQGYNQTEIAMAVGRDKSTICREFQRNSNWKGIYRPSKAAEKANGRRSRSRKKPQFTEKDLKPVFKLLEEDYSPEQISGTLKLSGELSISHEKIYQIIWEDKINGGDWYTHLRQSPKQRRKRYRSKGRRGVMKGKRPIEKRPISAFNRSRIGHFEIDTIRGRGSQHCILTMVDRKTGFLIMRKLRSRTTSEVNKALRTVLRNNKWTIKSITADNGTEFHQFNKVEKSTGVPFYFAAPYRSWERPTNENTNGLIRQYFPKDKPMTRVTQYDCTRIAKKLNRRPRKRYGFRKPEDLFLPN